jgi:HD-GYP domain-containing protein (c-di-GMP phosphodiesterase class II)
MPGTAHRNGTGIPQDVMDGIYFGSLVHDIGKIVVPGEILTKPGKLSPIEFSLIKAHPEEGFKVVNSIEFPWPIATWSFSITRGWTGRAIQPA